MSLCTFGQRSIDGPPSHALIRGGSWWPEENLVVPPPDGRLQSTGLQRWGQHLQPTALE